LTLTDPRPADIAKLQSDLSDMIFLRDHFEIEGLTGAFAWYNEVKQVKLWDWLGEIAKPFGNYYFNYSSANIASSSHFAPRVDT